MEYLYTRRVGVKGAPWLDGVMDGVIRRAERADLGFYVSSIRRTHQLIGPLRVGGELQVLPVAFYFDLVFWSHQSYLLFHEKHNLSSHPTMLFKKI
jgi:hypothetical protein